jgi:hypothetical protein
MALVSDYRLDFFTASGVKVAEVSDYYELAYTKRVNEPGLLQFILPGNHRAISTLAHDYQVNVMRRNTDAAINLDWYCDFSGLMRGQEEWNDGGVEYYKAICPGVMTLLSDYIIAYPSASGNRTTFASAKAETIMRTLVQYNATSAGTIADGRKRDVTTKGITVVSDSAQGATITSSDFAWDNLLTKLQDVALIASGDFSLTYSGGAIRQFRFYPNQLGTDRSTTVVFSLDRANMQNPRYTLDRTSEKTVAIIGGGGEDSNRAIALASGVAYSSTNAKEVFVDARNSGTVTSALLTAGNTKLSDLQAREYLTFDILQTASCFYGKHYFLGDKVKGVYKDHTVIQKVQGVTVAYKNQDKLETIAIELRAV